MTDRFGQTLKRASLMPPKNIKTYNSTHFYIFDDFDTAVHQSQSWVQREHQRSCVFVKNFFQNHVNCTLHSVTNTTPQMTGETFIEWWSNELAQYTRDVLVIVYFHGAAYGCNSSYTWSFLQRGEVNAHDLFKATNVYEPDCLWMLECPFPTRFHDLPSRARGHSDYTIAGQNLKPTRNDTDQEPWNYSYQLVRILAEWVSGIEDRYRDWHKRKSIPEILAYNRELCSNPLRLWESKTKAGSEQNVYRFCNEPDNVRVTRMIEFIRVRIQGLDKHRRNGRVIDNDNSDSDSDSDPDDLDSEHSDQDEQPTYGEFSFEPYIDAVSYGVDEGLFVRSGDQGMLESASETLTEAQEASDMQLL